MKVKVRAAVVIDEDGNYWCYGRSNMTDTEAIEESPHHGKVLFIESEIETDV